MSAPAYSKAFRFFLGAAWGSAIGGLVVMIFASIRGGGGW